MADLADVENAVKAVVVGAVYPNGPSNPSVVSVQVAIGRGWPVASDIDAAMQAGACIVSIYSQPNVERNTTRYPRDDQVVTAPVHTLTTTMNGKTVTIGGTVSTPQNVIVLCGSQSFAYSVPTSGATLNSIAAGVGALIAVSFPGTSATGPVITIVGNPGAVQARILGQGTVWTEQRRQERGIQVSCWCPTAALRDQLAAAIDLAFAPIDFLTLADQSAARIRYERTLVSDEAQKVQIFRRDMFYTVEYPTATTTTAFETGAIELAIESPNTVSIAF